MYITSKALISDIDYHIQKVKHEFGSILSFEEYIAIPYLGSNIILRFALVNDEVLCVEDIDKIESTLRKTVGEKYFSNLMGVAYSMAGLLPSMIGPISEEIDTISDIIIPINHFHKSGLSSDTAIIKDLFKMDEAPNVWEIQVNPDGLLVLIIDNSVNHLHPKTEIITEYDGQTIRGVFMPQGKSYRGLMKALIIAEEQNVSMCNILLSYKK